uniref:Signal recognition particle 54 kDa protein n=1 Tax=uncultured korarchaeote TaxID=161241 RepID=A0A1L2JM32_9CREN|nr:signal recognition particle GTPase [uncultured korarchaeote]
MSLYNLKRSLSNAVKRFLRVPTADERAVNALLKEIQRALIKADVNVRIVAEFTRKVREKSLSAEVPPGFSRRDIVLKSVYDGLVEILGERRPTLQLAKGTNIMLFVGIEGSGKTTTVAKLAVLLKRKGYRVAVVCADDHRPGAYQQLLDLLSEHEIPVYWERGVKAPELAEHGVKKLREEGYNVILVDTAGRHKNEQSLIEEMQVISAKVKPTHTFLVVDAATGQFAYQQAKAFHEVSPIGGVIVTKLDGTAKGGGALSAVVATGAPIYFICTGEKLDEIEPFDPNGFVSRLLGMGDLRALSERLHEAYIEMKKLKEAELLPEKFNLLAFRLQLQQARKLGPLSKLLELLPGGLSLNLPPEAAQEASKKIDKWLVIMDSMTREELENPKIIDRSRINRIARGAGVYPEDVREMLSNYKRAKRMMKAFKSDRAAKRMLEKLTRSVP